jgi:hypothetical protein
MTLPQSRAFITSLITSLNTSPTSTTATSTSSNPLKQATPAEKSTLLTLHVLYPNELLAALDLLDRELVIKMIPHSPTKPPPTSEGSDIQMEGTTTESDNTATTATTATSSEDKNGIRDKGYDNAIYYVRSAQQTSSNSRFRDPVASSTHYEVRTSSWSCSCPAFTFAAFPVVSFDVEEEEGDGEIEAEAEEGGNEEWRVGGLSLGKDVPMCKHLLACVLAERAGSFRGYVKTREVSIEELAGWAAGWGG